jgi:hypothetical protein
MADDPQVSTPWSAEAFRERATKSSTVTLPSGAVVSLRRELGAADLVLQGELPEHLTPHVFSDLEPERAATAEERRQAQRERVETINRVCCAMILAPTVVLEDPGAGELAVSELSWPDRMFVFAIACGEVDPAGGLARFPGGSAEGVPSSSDGGAVRPAAERAPRARRR